MDGNIVRQISTARVAVPVEALRNMLTNKTSSACQENIHYYELMKSPAIHAQNVGVMLIANQAPRGGPIISAEIMILRIFCRSRKAAAHCDDRLGCAG